MVYRVFRKKYMLFWYCIDGTFVNKWTILISQFEFHLTIILSCSGLYSYWISVNDVDDNGIFTDADDRPISYDNFKSSSKGECAILESTTTDLKWSTVKCDRLRRSVCSFIVWHLEIFLRLEKMLISFACHLLFMSQIGWSGHIIIFLCLSVRLSVCCQLLNRMKQRLHIWHAYSTKWYKWIWPCKLDFGRNA